MKVPNIEQIDALQLHDGQLNGFLLINQSSLLVMISYNRTKQTNVCLSLKGIDCLKINDFLEGNTILDIEALFLHELTSKELEVFPFCNQAHEAKTMYDQLVSKNKIIVFISPSYGAELVCVCDSIHIEEDWKSLIN